jgi:hypothetical protein
VKELPVVEHPQHADRVRRTLKTGVAGDDARLRFWDGGVIETIDIDVIESGGTVYLELEQSGGGNLTWLFAGTEYVMDCTPAQTVALTAGTDTNPVQNYVYVVLSGTTPTLTASTVSWPATAHAPVATVVVQSAASLATDGAYKVHAWTDHINKATENGHSAHVNKKLRAFNATWQSGVAPSDFSSGQLDTTAGVVFQLHTHDMPARDMTTGDPVFVVNDNATPYKRITSIEGGGISTLSDGSSIGNNRYVNLVLWGVVSEKDADCKLMINLPDADYVTQSDAELDILQSASYSFGSGFVGCAFLIGRFTLQYSTAAGGTFTQTLKTDLRGLEPSTSPGGGAITDHGNLTSLGDDEHPQYLKDIVDDLTPQLGGDLDTNSQNIKFDTNHGIRDDSNNEQLIFIKTTSAVGNFTMTNASAGNDPILSAGPGGMILEIQAGNNFQFQNSDTDEILVLFDNEDADNYFKMSGNKTAPLLEVTGTGTNVDMYLQAKGTGTIWGQSPFRGGIHVDGDVGGLAGTVTHTDVVVAAGSGSLSTKIVPAGVSTPKWIKVYDGTTVGYVLAVF